MRAAGRDVLRLEAIWKQQAFLQADFCAPKQAVDASRHHLSNKMPSFQLRVGCHRRGATREDLQESLLRGRDRCCAVSAAGSDLEGYRMTLSLTAGRL
jgi:hypothetical protein